MTEPSFRDLGVPKKLNDALHRAGFTSPFPIQQQTVPPTLAGQDLCGRAPTGSGKTLAFSIPVVENIDGAEPHHPRALILVPTRELANQVRETILPLAQARRRWVASFTGGTNIKRDIDRLRRGVDIAVATPGRLEDLVQRKQIHLDALQIAVIDEADRMADMGFLPVVTRLLDKAPTDRQTLLFSATLDGDVDVLIRRYQRKPVRIEIEVPEEEQGHVNHLFWPTDRHQRREVASRALRNAGSAIVFTRTKHGADRLAKQLAKDGVTTAAIHGNRSQKQREKALDRFARGEVTTLVATDVAARGIHVDDVALVIHYDLPATEKDYVHRSGRTGRAGNRGTVLSMVCEDQHDELQKMQRKLDMPVGVHEIRVEHLDLDDVPQPSPSGRGKNGNGGSGSRATAHAGSRSRSGKSSHGGGGNSRNGGKRRRARRR